MIIPEHGKTEKVSSSRFHQEPETSRTLSQNIKKDGAGDQIYAHG